MKKSFVKTVVTTTLLTAAAAGYAANFQGIYFAADGAYFSGKLRVIANGVSIPNCFYQCQPTVVGPSLSDPVLFVLANGSSFTNLVNPYQTIGLTYGSNILAYVVIVGNKLDSTTEQNIAQLGANLLISGWKNSYCNPSNYTCTVSSPTTVSQFTPPTTYDNPQIQYVNYVYVSIAQKSAS